MNTCIKLVLFGTTITIMQNTPKKYMIYWGKVYAKLKFVIVGRKD